MPGVIPHQQGNSHPELVRSNSTRRMYFSLTVSVGIVSVGVLFTIFVTVDFCGSVSSFLVVVGILVGVASFVKRILGVIVFINPWVDIGDGVIFS